MPGPRPRKPPAVVATRDRLRTRSGWLRPTCWAIIPPMETPTTWASFQPRWSISATASSAMSAMV